MSKLKVLLAIASVFILLGLCSTLAYADGNEAGVVAGDSLNVRETPSTSAKVLTQLQEGTQVVILDSSDGWYKISYGSVTGWAKSKFVSVKDTVVQTGIITGKNVNLRSNPNTSADVIATLDDGTQLSVLSRSTEWYKVKTQNGTTGWINSEFISLRGSNVSRGAVEDAVRDTASTSTVAQQITSYAKDFLGVRYVYGGITPKGFDCSGFVSYVYSHFGVTLQRVAADQAKQGVKVSKGDLMPGDLVFFDTDGGHNYINHVGMYIGNGQFIQASSGSSAHKVIISELAEGFYANAYMTARRILR